jgi:hypothetical protein
MLEFAERVLKDIRKLEKDTEAIVLNDEAVSFPYGQVGRYSFGGQYCPRRAEEV